jgi:hypothetical protein
VDGVKPWHASGWWIDRLRELLWQALSWPYLIALSLTAFFLLRPDALTRDAMLASWGLAFLRREGGKLIDFWTSRAGR